MKIDEFKRVKEKIRDNRASDKEYEEFIEDIFNRAFVVPMVMKDVPIVFANDKGDCGVPAISDAEQCKFIPQEMNAAVYKLKTIDKFVDDKVPYVIIDPFDKPYILTRETLDVLFRGGKA